MGNYWVGDSLGRVMGPVSLQVISDLVARGRLQGLVRASMDGRSWRPLAEVPELHAAILTAAAPKPSSVHEAEASRIEKEAQRLQALPPRQRLGVPATASAFVCRAAFFEKAKNVHASTLPTDAPPSLRRAYDHMFRVLREAMTAVEREPPPPVSSAAPRAASAGAPSYVASEFIGWTAAPDGKISVEIEVTSANARMFTQCEQACLDNDGFFLPSRKPLPLLQMVEVTLRFANPAKEIRARGRVILDRSTAREPGLGIRLVGLDEADKRFVRYFVRRA